TAIFDSIAVSRWPTDSLRHRFRRFVLSLSNLWITHLGLCTTRRFKRRESRFQREWFLGSMNPGAVPQTRRDCCALGAKQMDATIAKYFPLGVVLLPAISKRDSCCRGR